jgi:riboflavin kinase/FMN adenylyltransferase
VEFRKKLREEKRFDSFELLAQQIELDAAEARSYFGLSSAS